MKIPSRYGGDKEDKFDRIYALELCLNLVLHDAKEARPALISFGIARFAKEVVD